MVSPSSETPTYAKDNKNGFLSSLLAWIRGPATVIGSRNFPGFYVWESDMDAEILEGLPDSCQSSLTQVVKCHPYVMRFWSQAYRSSLHNDTLTASICDPGCGDSLKSWFNSVSSNCAGYNVSSSAPTKYGGQLWTGYNETCLQDPETGDYCNGEQISLPGNL